MNVRIDFQRVTPFSCRRSCRAHARTLSLVAAVLIATTLLVPLLGPSQGALASPANRTAPETAAFQDDGSGGYDGSGITPPNVDDTPGTDETPDGDETPVVEETPVADETPITDETSGDGVEGIQGETYTSGMNVYMRECDSTDGIPFATLDANCGRAAQISFDAYGAPGLASYGIKGAIELRGLPSGQYTIRETIPQGYTEPTVYCSRGTSGGQASALSQVVTYEGYYEFSLAQNETINCHSFNAARPVPPKEYGELYVYKFLCPEDPNFDYHVGDQPALYSRCDLYPSSEITFDLYSTVDFSTQSMTANDMWEFSWYKVEGGGLVLTEKGWTGGGSPIVFCTTFGNGESINWSRTDISGSTATFDLAKFKKTVCHWFTVPETSRVTTSGSTVTINTYTCDERDASIDAYTAEREKLVDGCVLGALNGSNLTVSSDAAETLAPATATVADGSATWNDIQAGNLTVTAPRIEGYGEPIVFCSMFNPAALVFESVYEAVEVQDSAFRYPLNKDYSVTCDLFTVPPAEDGDSADSVTGTVTIIAYACPKGTSGQGTYKKFESACTATREGATFKLDGAKTGNPGEKTTGADGSATWSKRSADHYYLYEQDVPAGYGTPVVFCSTYEALLAAGTPNYVAYPLNAEDRVEFDLASGKSITCRWFGIPGAAALVATDDQDTGNSQDDGSGDDGSTASSGTGSIAVYEWDCPAGFDVAAQDANPWIECAMATDGGALTITGADGTTDEQSIGSSQTGEIRWDSLRSGDYLIDDTQPNDVASGFVLACHGLDAPAAYPLYSSESGEPLALSLAEGQQVACLWFNVPAAA